jgi:spermidine dehydrogenase
MLHPLADESGSTDQMFPGGNTTIARLMLKTLIPAAIDGPDTVEGVSRNRVHFSALDAAGGKTRIRLSSTAISVQHDGDPDKSDSVIVAYLKHGKLYRVKARSAVMAG